MTDIELKLKTVDQMIDTIMEIAQELVGPDQMPGDISIHIYDGQSSVRVNQHDQYGLLFREMATLAHADGLTVHEAVQGYMFKLIFEKQLRKMKAIAEEAQDADDVPHMDV